MGRAGGFGVVAAVWGTLGLMACLIEAIYRLTPLALQPIEQGMHAGHWALYVGFVIANAYAEGYRGFQLRFAPRVAARTVLLAREPNLWRATMAPLFVMALIDATRRRLIASWLLVVVIVALVLGVRSLAQPWRGIVDAGVVVGLSWGTLSVVWELLRVMRGHAPRVDPELAEPRPARAVQAQPQNT